MSSTLQLPNPAQTIDTILAFLQETYRAQSKTRAIIAVSGGIDSAVSLSLVTRALGPDQVTAVFLPFADQSIADGQLMAEHVGLAAAQQLSINIEPIVTAAAAATQLEPSAPDAQLRLGNLKARARMIILFDLAKKLDALVCGTENKSEKHLAYFTRFGDEASDIEPIQHLYKTQVRQLAEYLGLPSQILTKAPSADLWQGQTDEDELGFTYQQADEVMAIYVDESIQNDTAFDASRVGGVPPEVVEKVIGRIKAQAFKHHVPYVLLWN